MHYHPKLILLNGPVGVGKSTIAERYIKDHPLALALNGDEIMVMIGGWLEREAEARKLLFELSKSMIATHLASGHSVIAPYIVTDPNHAAAFEQIATENKARFYEIALMAPTKEEAIARAHERGSWGERGTEPLSPTDTPILESIYDRMMAAMEKRPHTTKLTVVKGDPEKTYSQFMQLFK
jgi:predicted kinase